MSTILEHPAAQALLEQTDVSPQTVNACSRHLTKFGGHAGAAGDETLDATASLGDLYARMRTGAFNVGSPDGQWASGLALIKESVALRS